MIPIFRAKKLDSDEYVEGEYSDTLFLCMGDIQGHYISYKKINVVGKKITLQESIDPTTISIHFSDMLDSKGNKIFASLQEDGRGGDIVTILDTTFKATYKYLKGKFLLDNGMDTFNPYLKYKIIGIQQ